MWEYFLAEGPYLIDTLQSFMLRDSVGTDGRIYVTERSRLINPNVHFWTKNYVVDTTLKQVWGALEFSYGILYKLEAQIGDKWVRATRGGPPGYAMCRVYSVEQAFLLGRQTTIKRFVFYQTRDSTDTSGVVTEVHWLASGFGLMFFTCPDCFYYIYLKGAVIDGVLYGDTTRIVTSVPDFSTGLPTQFELFPPYPNPFNPSTTIKYDLPKPAMVSLIVYDVLGRKVAELVNEQKAAGYHSIVWNAPIVASGVYLARFTATDANGYSKYSKISKLILMK